MSNLAFVAVAIRLVGIWIVLSWCYQAFNVVVPYAIFYEDKPFSLFASLLPLLVSPVAVWSVFGIVMIIWPSAIARLLTPGSVRREVSISWSPVDLQSIGFRVVGLYLLATTLAGSSLWGLIVIGLFEEKAPSNAALSLALLKSAAGIVIGIWLLLGAEGLVELLRNARGGAKSDMGKEREG